MGIFKNTNVFGKYVSPLTGSDLNVGSSISPYQSVTKALSIGGTILLNGIATENITKIGEVNITGDNEFAYLSGINVLSAYNDGTSVLEFLKINDLTVNQSYISRCRIKFLHAITGYGRLTCYHSFITSIEAGQLGSIAGTFSNNTIFDFFNKMKSYNGLDKFAKNCIFINSVDLYNYDNRDSISQIPIFKNCLFRKATIWKWNGVTIPVNYGTYGNAAGDYLADVISAMYAYTGTVPAGAERTYFSAMFPNAVTSPIFYIDPNGQTCKVVEDRPSVGGSKKIFNRYIGDNPVDYSLFLHADNVALIMSDELSYVGCYKANADVLTFGDVMSVNIDGSDDLITPPDMLIYDGNGKFRVSIADSVQIRNRVRSSVFHFKRGFTLDGFQSQMKSGLNSRFSLGKFQPYNITDAPTLPQESIEVIPYDDAVTPSAFPRFSAMFNGKVQMWYHTAGAKKDLPVLFNDLLAYFAIVTDKSLAEYGTWAVTNADYETFALSIKANVKLQNLPVYFAQVEINLNYHV